MIYDFIIAGGGIAGSVCAYELCRNGKTCVVLEKEQPLHEKICGGGVPYKAIRLLTDIGINLMEQTIQEQTQRVTGHIINSPHKNEEKIYSEGNVSLGLQRSTLDSFLQLCAKRQGADIQYGEKVCEINNINGLYIVNKYMAREFVCAVGARGIGNITTNGQSVGISMQIEGNSILRSDRFHYWYFTDSDDKYFWIFPIGRSRWNIGVWYRMPSCQMKSEFENGIKNYVLPNFPYGYEIISKPRGEFLGNMDQRTDIICNGIGDFAGMNNIKNGGGIIGAIESAIKVAMQLIC